MPSNFIKVITAFTALVPAILLLYFAQVWQSYQSLSIRWQASSWRELFDGANELLRIHHLLFLSVFLFIILISIVRYARREFARERISIKSIKPVDYTFVTVLFSFIPAIVKLTGPNLSGSIMLSLLLFIAFVYGFVLKDSYHFNVLLKMIGYRHYEVATKKEVTYLMLSKRILINSDQVKTAIKLGGHMLLDVSDLK